MELVGDPLREKYQTLPHIGSQFGIFFELFLGTDSGRFDPAQRDLAPARCRQAVAWQGQLPIGQAELSVCGRVRLVADWLIGWVNRLAVGVDWLVDSVT